MTVQIRRRGRHHAGYKLSERMRMVRGGALWALILAAVFLTGAAGAFAQPMPSQAAARPRPVVWVLRYVPHTILCHRWQIGADGLVYGNGKPDSIPVDHPFKVVCEWDGAIPAWDAESW